MSKSINKRLNSFKFGCGLQIKNLYQSGILIYCEKFTGLVLARLRSWFRDTALKNICHKMLLLLSHAGSGSLLRLTVLIL